MPFDEAVADFPDDAINRRPPNVDYTPWHLLEHLRLTQADILDYVTNEAYVEPSWPADYWPARDADGDAARCSTRRSGTSGPTWRRCARSWSTRPATCSRSSPGRPDTRSCARSRIDADHNAYHVGEFAILRQVMGTWPEGHR